MSLTGRGHDQGPRPSRVFLHIGAPVTGSPYLREVLSRHRRQLARSGVLFPSNVAGEPGHLGAVLDVLDLTEEGHGSTSGAWDRLAQAARDWRRGTVVISHELLADADDAHVKRVLAGLGRSEVHVVYAARDLARQLPLAWQEWVRNGGTATFASYVDKVAGRGRQRLSQVFWSSHDVEEVLGRWSAHLPPERVHVLTVPDGPGQDTALWERFAATVGIPARLEQGGGAGPEPMSRTALECVRLLNLETGEPPTAAVLAAAATVGGPAPALAAEHQGWLRAEAERAVAAVKGAGYDVVGDLTELRHSSSALATDERQVVVAPEDVVAAQTRLLATLLDSVGRPPANAEGPAGRSRRTLRERTRRGQAAIFSGTSSPIATGRRFDT